jgi:hypothetical protein
MSPTEELILRLNKIASEDDYDQLCKILYSTEYIPLAAQEAVGIAMAWEHHRIYYEILSIDSEYNHLKSKRINMFVNWSRLDEEVEKWKINKKLHG